MDAEWLTWHSARFSSRLCPCISGNISAVAGCRRLKFIDLSFGRAIWTPIFEDQEFGKV